MSADPPKKTIAELIRAAGNFSEIGRKAGVAHQTVASYHHQNRIPDSPEGHRVAYVVLVGEVAQEGRIRTGKIRHESTLSASDALELKREQEAKLVKEKVRKIRIENAALERQYIATKDVNELMLAQARRWREQVDTARRAVESVASDDCREMVVDTFDEQIETMRVVIRSQWEKLDDGEYSPS